MESVLSDFDWMEIFFRFSQPFTTASGFNHFAQAGKPPLMLASQEHTSTRGSTKSDLDLSEESQIEYNLLENDLQMLSEI